MSKWVTLFGLAVIGLLPLACGSKNDPSLPAPVTVYVDITNTPTITATITATPIYTMIPVTIVANTQYPTTSAPSYSAVDLWLTCPSGTGLCISGSVSLGTSINNQATTIVSIPQGQFTIVQVNEGYSLPLNYTLGGTLELIVSQPNVSPVTSYGSAVTSGSDIENDAGIDIYVGSSATSVR